MRSCTKGCVFVKPRNIIDARYLYLQAKTENEESHYFETWDNMSVKESKQLKTTHELGDLLKKSPVSGEAAKAITAKMKLV